MVNPIQQLKNQPSCDLFQSLAEGESPDKLIQEQNLDVENIEEITQENYLNNFPYLGIQLDQKRQKEVATIVVESSPSDEESIIIRCYHGLLKISEQLTTKPIKAPEISFAKIMEELKIIGGFLGPIRMFAQENTQAKRLRGWLLRLQEKLEKEYQQELSYLIINDRTNFEIPWELLELTKNNYVGAKIATVRWQDISDPDNLDDVDSLIHLKIEENKCCGNIVAYLNRKDLPSVNEERHIIEQFNHIIHENIHNFWGFLDSVNLEVSLIFIASHGFFGDNLSETRLGEENRKQQISLPELYEYDFDFLANHSSLIFINTCHSGRLQTDETLKIIDSHPETGQDFRMGFATFFLKKGADGVIGTLGKVADKYAAKVAKNFFDEYQKNPQLSVAKILKTLRLKAIQNYQSQKTTENKYLLLSTFMYIYYGNPMTKLELIEKEGY